MTELGIVVFLGTFIIGLVVGFVAYNLTANRTGR